MKVLYILMRTDMPSMTTGRAMAQASHASNAFVHRWSKDKAVQEWQKETPYGFGTAIVLACNEDQLFTAVKNAQVAGVHSMVVEDPEYGRRIPNELVRLIDTANEVSPRVPNNDGTTTIYTREATCGYVFGEKEQCQEFIGHLKLHP